MMKQNRLIVIGVISILVGLFCGLPEPAHCQGPQDRTDDTVLLLQQSNLEAGIVTPDVGVHYFGLNTEVALTATPKLGYHFVYWIGDVSDPTANRTIVYLDVPKIIIAVFERSEYELVLEEVMQYTLGGGGGLYPSAADYGKQGYSGGGAKRPPKYRPPERPQPPQPVPEEEPNEFPVPEHLPEPATILLLGLGGLLLVKSRPKSMYHK
jgi:hypothetical protein